MVLTCPLVDLGDGAQGLLAQDSRGRETPPKPHLLPPPGARWAPAVHTALIIQGLFLSSGRLASLPAPPSGPGLGSGSSKGHQQSRWDQGLSSSWRRTTRGSVVQTTGTTSSGGHHCSQQSPPFTNQQPPWAGGLPTARPPGRRVGHEPVGEVSSQKEIQGGPRRGVVHVEGTYSPIQTSPS